MKEDLPAIGNSSPSLIPGGGWYAAVEGYSTTSVEHGTYQATEPSDRASLRYTPVIAWETYIDESDGEARLRAWLSGSTPFASDRFGEHCNTYFINHFVPALPEGKKGDWFWA